MEQHLPVKELESDDAHEYADLLGVSEDLKFVLAATDRLLQEFANTHDKRDWIAIRAYWSAATIAYARCFSGGKRQGLKPAIFDSIVNASRAHQHIQDTRDKHVAHSVNAFEQIKVGFILGAAPTASAEAVTHCSIFRVCDEEGGIRNLQLLVHHASKHLQPRIEKLQHTLLEQGQKMPRSELDKLPNLKITASAQRRRRRK